MSEIRQEGVKATQHKIPQVLGCGYHHQKGCALPPFPVSATLAHLFAAAKPKPQQCSSLLHSAQKWFSRLWRRHCLFPGKVGLLLSVRSPPPTLIPPHSPSQAPYLPQAARSISEIHVLSHHSPSDHTGPAGGCNQETTGQS